MSARADETAEDEHRPDTDGRPTIRGPYRDVVLGVDTEHPCGALLGFGSESAALRSTSLEVVPTWRLPPPYGYVPSAPATGFDSEHQAEAESRFASLLLPWRERDPPPRSRPATW